ncbi:MAG: hypothetical protein U0V87_12460 [Acidobacteriota bacterium]
MPRKLIVTHRKAMIAKYKNAGWKQIESAIQQLIAADGKRGLQTSLLLLDDANALGNSAMNKVGDQKQAKQAIDAAFRKRLDPEYLMILGGPELVPHQDLINPVTRRDPDKLVPSDLPYACAGAHHTDVRRFIGATRVVGRLPDVVGRKDPSYLIGLLETAAGAPSIPMSKVEHFAVSAQIWVDATQAVLRQALGAHKPKASVAPPSGPPWKRKALARTLHLINCHGGPADPQFYGEDEYGDQPVSYESADLVGKIPFGAVAAAECCYGAELYDPGKSGPPGISNVYLAEGAAGYLGSTTIAYGADSSDISDADILCELFLSLVLGGATLGRALLQARQTYVKRCAPLSQTEYKTLAQFLLLGDPSQRPVVPKGETVVASGKSAAKHAKHRKFLITQGKCLPLSVPKSSKVARRSGARLRDMLTKLARRNGVEPTMFESFRVAKPAARAKGPAMKGVMGKRTASVHLMFGADLKQAKRRDRSVGPVVPITLVVAKLDAQNAVVSSKKVVSRGAMLQATKSRADVTAKKRSS